MKLNNSLFYLLSGLIIILIIYLGFSNYKLSISNFEITKKLSQSQEENKELMDAWAHNYVELGSMSNIASHLSGILAGRATDLKKGELKEYMNNLELVMNELNTAMEKNHRGSFKLGETPTILSVNHADKMIKNINDIRSGDE